MTKIVNSVEYKLINLKNNSFYFISKDGDIYSDISKKILKKIVNGNGYYGCSIKIGDKIRTYTIHRLLAFTYIPNKENKTYINHVNGIKTDNRLCNLEWCTCQENIKHAYDNGLKSNKGDKHPSNKLTEKDVLELREYYNKNKVTYRELAKKYKVRDTTISKAIRGITFPHI